MGFSRQEYWSGVPLPSLLAPLPAGNPAASSFVETQAPLSSGYPANYANYIADSAQSPVVLLYLTVHTVHRTQGRQGTK